MISAHHMLIGCPGEYNHWRSLGNAGWDFDDIEPYFVKSEKARNHLHSKHRGQNGMYRRACFFRLVLAGQFIIRTMGESPVYAGAVQNHEPVSRTLWIRVVCSLQSSVHRALKNAGVPLYHDLSSPDVPAAATGYYDVIEDASYHRLSTDRAFLPASIAHARKAHLKICTNTIVTKIHFSTEGHGVRATGVYFEAASTRKAGQRFFASARREITLCAGALGSPHLLMLRYGHFQTP